MEPVESLPRSRGNRTFIEQAERIRNDLREAAAPMLVAKCETRSSLESIAKHLRKHGDVKAVLIGTDKNEQGETTEYSLYAEYTG